MMARNADVSHINERRLRPIYDCLDNGNNKKALQESEKVLKKQKDLTCAKVLKALALLRLGRHEDSLHILREVHNESPTDDSSLQAMTICYRELHKIELIADAYENAIKKDPTNEELHSHLFMAYVRMSDYKRQKLAAMSLYRLKPKNPYYFWAVMSILMEAMAANDLNIAQKVTLPLAEKMCQKFFDESKIEAEAEVELYLMILEKQKKFKEMLHIMESPIGAKLSNHLDFLSKRKADLLRLVGRLEEAFDAYKHLIENNIDQIDYYLELIDISNTLDNNREHESQTNETQSSCHYISLVMILIEECIKKGTTGLTKSLPTKPFQRQRGPYLAKMVLFEQLSKRQKTRGDVEHLLKPTANSITDLLFEYFVDFGSKQCCIYDMFYILDKTDLNEQQIQNLTLQMKQLITSISENEKDLDAMHKHMCYYYICYYLGQYDHLSPEERHQLIECLSVKYQTYYNNIIVKTELTPTEPQPTDPYVILIVDILLSNNELLDNSIVCQSIGILEMALSKSPANFHFKLLLIKLYNIIGAVSASHTILDTLDIKHIQYDSLGYIFTTPLIISGHFSTCSQLLGNALKFYSANSKDTLDYLISCYKFGSFTKVEEILKLRDRLNNSLQYCLSAIERMFLDLILETKNHSSTDNIINYMEIDAEKDKFVWEDICDNRDFSVIRSNNQKNERIIKESQSKTFNDELLWLQIRNLIIRAIAASHNIVSNYVPKKEVINNNSKTNVNIETNGTEKRNNIDILRSLSSSLRECIDSVNRSKFSQSMIPLEGPFPSRIVAFSKLSHFEVILSLIDFIIILDNEPKENSFSTDIKSGDIFSTIVDELELLVNKTNSLLSIGSTLEALTNCIETLSICVIFVGICQSFMKNKMNISNKKNRKKKDNTGKNDLDNNALVKCYTCLVNKLEESAHRIDKNIKSLDIVSICSDCFTLSELFESDSIRISIRENVEKSYNQSIKELTEVLQNKILYLHSLHF